MTDIFKNKKFIFLDGAMGTMIQESGADSGHVPELLGITNPEIIMNIHKAYIQSGSDIIYANTFGANRFKLAGTGYTVEQVIKANVANAKKASEGKALVALDLGPIGQLLEPTGKLTFEESYNCYKEQVIAGTDADLIVLETMTDLYEVKSAVLAVKENSDKPLFVTMTFEENQRTFTGVSVECMATLLQSLGVDAIGVNCSLGADELYPIVKKLSENTNLPLIVKANAGLPDPVTNKFNVTPEQFAESNYRIADLGVKIFGGCCGTTPEHIKALVEKVNQHDFIERNYIPKSCVCSAVKCVEINQPRVIGERINPTGKKLFKQALLDNNIDYILNQAIEQVHAGADILDVNVGLPSIDEKSMMIRVVKAVQSVVDVPLQLDSTIPEVLDAGLRVYNGKPIVNSVNGEDESLEKILPLVKKYGASVVGLTLDKNGIPKTSEGRFAIAEKILNKALEYGIPKEDVYIDCLTLTASAEQEGVMETLNALKRVKEELGLKTVLGVSNISFGLPNRELITRTFLTMALQNGLDLPIINPNIDSIIGAVRAYKLLKGIDKNSVEFISIYSQENTPKPVVDKKSDIDIFYALENGLKNDGIRITAELLEKNDPMEVINNYLVPALDIAGDKFEKGKIFLPQLILTAGTAQACFEVIKEKIVQKGDKPVSKGKVVLATVKGDIHDIGKNIVKVLLESYGYDVIDLGKDVDKSLVLKSAVENQVKLVGLSALMTTTLKSMEETIELLNQQYPECKT
ncbi:MAG: homocysteine S-methyltransferase family protein, partial [Ruminococcus sp.]|nr:homocysteine S-methyltransferase family protein [Ruminococcus sp.]